MMTQRLLLLRLLRLLRLHPVRQRRPLLLVSLGLLASASERVALHPQLLLLLLLFRRLVALSSLLLRSSSRGRT